MRVVTIWFAILVLFCIYLRYALAFTEEIDKRLEHLSTFQFQNRSKIVGIDYEIPYYWYQLESNKLNVLLVQTDPKESGIATVQMGIPYGLALDFRYRTPGLYHLVEHCLVYKSPVLAFDFKAKKIDYAKTSNRTSHFHFKIDKDKLEEYLKEYCMDKDIHPEDIEDEYKAIDAEFQLRKMLWDFRARGILSENSNPLHPFSYFSIGSLEGYQNLGKTTSLGNLIKDVVSEYFSSDKMILVIQSPNPIDQVKDMVSKYFLDVPLRKFHPIEPLRLSYRPPFLPEQQCLETLISEPFGSPVMLLYFTTENHLPYMDSSVRSIT